MCWTPACSPRTRTGSTEVQYMADDDRKKANRRLGLILASIVFAFFLGFVAKMVFLGG